MAAAGSKGKQGRRRSVTPEERATVERDFKLAVYRLQDSAYAGLRSAIANVAIFVGFFAVFAISIGEADGARLIPTVLCVLAGLVGGAFYLTRSRPKLAMYLLAAGSTLGVIGVTWLIIAAQAGDP